MEDKAPFFTQLKALGAHVDFRVKSLKQEMNKLPGQNPEKYDEGLEKLKKDVKELKKQSQEIRENLTAFSRFSGYLRDAQELVEEQIAGTEKMEQFCAQYGYVIPPKADVDTSPTTEAATPVASEGKGPDESRQKSGNNNPVTPELSAAGQMLMQGKVLPLLTPGRKVITASSNIFPATPITKTPITTKTPVPKTPSTNKTPITSKIPITTKTPISKTPIATKTPITPKSHFTPGRASSIPRPYMMMEQWLTGADESCTVTPSVIPQKSETSATGKQTESQEPTPTPSQDISLPDKTKPVSSDHISLQGESYKGKVPCIVTTPTEPILSAQGTQVLMQMKSTCAASLNGMDGSGSSKLQVTQITTPEEPVLYSQHNSLLNSKNNYEEIGTPEEPVLHCSLGLEGTTLQKGTPEEPILSYQENLPFGLKTSTKNEESLEDPILFYQQNSRDCIDITPKAPSLSSMQRLPKDPKMHASYLEENDEIPKTPDLSDMTRSVLSLISNKAPSQPQKDHKEHQQSYKQFQGLSQPHIELRGLSEPCMDRKGSSQPHRNHQGLPLPYRELRGLSQPQKDYLRVPQPSRDLQGMSQPHRDLHRVPQPHRDLHGVSQPSRDLNGMPQSSRDLHGVPQSSRDIHGVPQSSRDLHGVPQSSRDLPGVPQPSRDLQGPPQPNRDLQGLPQPNRDLQGVPQPHRDDQRLPQTHRDPLGLLQHREHQEPSQAHREQHHHHHHHHHAKLSQSFSAAMNKLNRTRDDENRHSVMETPPHWSTSLANQKDKVTWDKGQGTVDQWQIECVPPSPQLSDITQKVLGQLQH